MPSNRVSTTTFSVSNWPTDTERCLAAGENIVLEGTFSWPGLGRRLLSDLAEADYQKLTILFCRSADRDHEGARALSRWWRGRETAQGGGDDLGGRFTPSAVTVALYTESSVATICACNARAAFDDPLAAEIPTVELLVENVGGVDQTWVKENGRVVYRTP